MERKADAGRETREAEPAAAEIGISQLFGMLGKFEMWETNITAPPSGGCAHDPAESRMLAPKGVGFNGTGATGRGPASRRS
jgi:hypothetical protein